jgi:MazG family protein
MQRLLEIMAHLRDPDSGCPWDVEQTMASLVPHTIEEAYEVAEAVESDDPDRGDGELIDELGDLLLQVVFYAQIGREEGRFDFGDVVAAVSDKLVRRHPHVFGDAEVADAEEQRHAWESLKEAERGEEGSAGGSSALDGVDRSLPAATRANKLQERAARAGFDWSSWEEVFAKMDEELAELCREVIHQGASERVQAEVGDVLFAGVGVARRLGADPETALRGTNRRFEARFRALEGRLGERGVRIADTGPAELLRLWEEVKEESAED